MALLMLLINSPSLMEALVCVRLFESHVWLIKKRIFCMMISGMTYATYQQLRLTQPSNLSLDVLRICFKLAELAYSYFVT